MDLRDGLIAVGVIVLLVIVIDGIRRMRNRSKIKLSIDKQFENLPEEDLSAELPNGGARPAQASAAQSGEEVDLLMDDDFKGVGAGGDEWMTKEPESTSILEKKIAPVFKYQQQDSPSAPERVEPSFSAEADLDNDDVDLLAEPKTAPVKSSQDDKALGNESLGNNSLGINSLGNKSLANDVLADSKGLEIESSDQADAADSSDGFSTNAFDDLDDGIIGPVRVRKVVGDEELTSSKTKPSAASSSMEEISVDKVEPEQTAAISDEPTLSVIEDTKAEPEYDFNRPVTELMADKLPPMSAPKASSVSEEADSSIVTAAAHASAVSNQEAKKDPSQNASISSKSAPLVAEASDLLAAESITADSLTDEPLTAQPLTAETLSVEPIAAEAITAEPRKTTANPKAKSRAKKKKTKRGSRLQRLKEEIQTSFFDIDPGLDPLQKEEPDTAELAEEAAAEVAEDAPVSAPSEPQVLSMMVSAREQFTGTQLFKLVEACGMEFGEMDIFHRHEEGKSQGAIQFSMVNGVKPGHFNPNESDTFTTPAVSFFLQMGEPSDLMNAFDCMLATAQCVADNLNGDVKDENQSVIRSQTIEHYRQQVRDFERRRLTRRA